MEHGSKSYMQLQTYKDKYHKFLVLSNTLWRWLVATICQIEWLTMNLGWLWSPSMESILILFESNIQKIISSDVAKKNLWHIAQHNIHDNSNPLWISKDHLMPLDC